MLIPAAVYVLEKGLKSRTSVSDTLVGELISEMGVLERNVHDLQDNPPMGESNPAFVDPFVSLYRKAKRIVDQGASFSLDLLFKRYRHQENDDFVQIIYGDHYAAHSLQIDRGGSSGVEQRIIMWWGRGNETDRTTRPQLIQIFKTGHYGSTKLGLIHQKVYQPGSDLAKAYAITDTER